jgi:hypothetical protein
MQTEWTWILAGVTTILSILFGLLAYGAKRFDQRVSDLEEKALERAAVVGEMRARLVDIGARQERLENRMEAHLNQVGMRQRWEHEE